MYGAVSSDQVIKSFERMDVFIKGVAKLFKQMGVFIKRVTKSFKRMQTDDPNRSSGCKCFLKGFQMSCKCNSV